MIHNNPMLSNAFTITLQQVKVIAPQVRHLVFTRDDHKPMAFIPGQFITIHFASEGKQLRRSYSLATIPGESEYIEFAAGYFPGGPATKLLFSIEPGAKITTTGPFGRLILRDEPTKRYILVATSTGVTPFRSMMPELQKRMQNNNTKVVLLQGVQRRENLLYAEEFITFAKTNPNFTFQAQYSRETNIELHAYEKLGYTQTAFEEINPKPGQDIVYLCGNPNMVDDAFSCLKKLGFDSKDVRREKYISAK